ncbi:MAG: VanZ family protein [Ornithinimicrobium sp.]|uniref:VanZ family protein n=1 Tax=Ornithinimicrobium sp. TaxID=1977084 RepID=UPI003D9B0240
MAERLAIGVAGGVLGAMLVALLLLPFVVLQPRRDGFGARRLLRAACVGGYVVAVGAVTLLPLPEPGSPRCQDGGASAYLLPLGVLGRVGTSTGSADLLGPALGDLVLNAVLFLPLGVLLGRWWGMRWGRALGASVLISLGIEATQLTGVWFLYDCSFRVFDVDDILANGLGGALGALLAGDRRSTLAP